MTSSLQTSSYLNSNMVLSMGDISNNSTTATASSSKKNRKKSNQRQNHQNQFPSSNRNSASNSSISTKTSRQNSNNKALNLSASTTSLNGSGSVSTSATVNISSKKTHLTANNNASNTTLTSPSSKIPHKDKSATFLTDVLLSLNYENNSTNNTNETSNKSNKKTTKQQQQKNTKFSSTTTTVIPSPHTNLLISNKTSTSPKSVTTSNEKSKQAKNTQKQQQYQTVKTINSSAMTKTVPSAKSKTTAIVTEDTSLNKTSTNRSSTQSKKNSDIRARYWAYLFENLKRSVDEIYQTCEYDNSISECKEVILILENCINDFRSLTSRIKLMKDFENAEINNKRPNSVAWDLGKSSPKMSTSTLLKSTTGSQKKNKAHINSQMFVSSSNNDDGGFKDFLPYSINHVQNKSNSKRYLNRDFDEEDEYEEMMDEEILDDDEYDNDADNENDLNEFIYDLKEKNNKNFDDEGDNDPIDLLNHETFSDMQSVNTEDMSFNAMSLSPPIPLSKFKVQSPPFNPLNQSLFLDQSFLFQNQGGTGIEAVMSINEQNEQFYKQFPLLMPVSNNQTSYNPPNAPDSSLSSSMVFNSGSGGGNTMNMQRPPGYFGPYSSSVFSNPSELSPFNYQTNKFNATYNFYGNNINNNPTTSNKDSSKQTHFNNNISESFDNADSSAHDESLMRQNLSGKENTFFKNYDNDDEFELDYLRNQAWNVRNSSNTNKEPKSKFIRYNNPIIKRDMLKFYEEEEQNIALELRQDKRLLSVLAKEAKLTKQLSMEKLMHFTQDFQEMDEDCDDNELGNTSKIDSTDFETTNETERNTPLNIYWNQCTASNNNGEKMCTDSEIEGVPRTPGRAVQVHEKLSFLMSRKASPNERRRKHEEKQARAQEKREQFYQDRLNKLRELTRKIEEVSEIKKRLLRAKKATMKAKLQRAEEKRQYLLRLKSTKASVEEQKAHEIAFINSLAAQNRKQDILEKYEKRHEAIKQNLEEERMRKQEEQKAKEHAAELRRKELETQRTAKLKEMLEKRKIKQCKIEQTQMEKEKERIETARAKEKTREMRLAIIEAQFQANRQQAKKRIMQKQEEWSKRHESNLEEIRKKAFEMSILRFSTEDNNHNGEAPTPVPYENAKYCNVCSVAINSEVKLKSHLGGIKHQQIMNETNQGKNLTKSEIEEYNLNCIVDLPKENNEKEMILNQERKKLMKKRLKKLKNKILTKGIEYETSKKLAANNSVITSTSAHSHNAKSKIPKLIKEIEKSLHSSSEKFVNLDKNCSEINRILQQTSNVTINGSGKQHQQNQILLQQQQQEQALFKSSDGFSIAIKLLELICQSPNDLNHYSGISTRTPINLINLIINASRNNYEACIDLILTNKLFSLLEILNIHSNVMLSELTPNEMGGTGGNKKNQISIEWSVCSSLMQLIASLFTILNNEPNSSENNSTALTQRANDLISLLTSYGLLDNLSVFFINIRGPLDDELQTVEILNNCLNFLLSITKFLAQKKSLDIFSQRKADDTTQLISTIKATNLVNIISMLYGMLHKDASTTPVKFATTTIKKQTTTTLELTKLSLKLLNQMIVLDLNMVQSLLGEECLSLQLRHISSYLIWYLNLNSTNNSSSSAQATVTSLTNVKCEEILHEIILLIGYFTVLNEENQVKIELGTPPTILQQLCNLSFKYFSDKKLILVLYPTLICCCFNNEKNKCVLTSELSAEMLANFIQEKINQEAKQQSTNNSLGTEDKFEFNKRFPVKLFNEALAYFTKKAE